MSGSRGDGWEMDDGGPQGMLCRIGYEILVQKRANSG